MRWAVISIVCVVVSVPCYGKYSGGSGDPSDPFLIGEPNDIIEMSNSPDDWGGHFRMIADIDLVGRIYTTAVIAPDTSDLLYFQGTPFTGVFDGNGHVISNLEIYSEGGRAEYLGLFGRIAGWGAEVKKLGLENVDIFGDLYLRYHPRFLGGLCGENEKGTINNCFSSGSVAGVSLPYVVGGLCGWNSGIISNCYVDGSVVGHTVTGGLCGYNRGTISNCYSSSFVSGENVTINVGAFCGYNHDFTAIRNCFWDVEGSGIGRRGYNEYSVGKTTEEMQRESTFTDAGWDFDPEDGVGWYMPGNDYPKLLWQQTKAYEGATEIFLGQNEYGTVQIDVFSLADEVMNWTITGYETCEWITNLTPASGSSDGPADKTTVVIDIESVGLSLGDYICSLTLAADNGDSFILPVFLEIQLSGSGGEDDPWLIESVEEFDEFSGDSSYWDDYVRLETDIDLGGRIYSVAVIAPNTPDVYSFQGTAFSGVFEGNWHVIRNLTIDTGGAHNDNLGLFGCIEGSGAEVTRLSVENVAISGGDWSDYLGGLSGKNSKGMISSCYSSGVVIGGEDSRCLGGLCGENDEGTIDSCYSESVVTSGNDSSYLGGLCGFSGGAISNCHAWGLVRSGDNCYAIGGLCGGGSLGTISNCYSLSSVAGGVDFDYLGGFSGHILTGIISNCFWDVEISGIGVAGDNNNGATGKTTLQMQTESTFTNAGWDFDPNDSDPEDWWMPINGYPKLWWEEDIRYGGGAGTEADPYQIRTNIHMYSIGMYPEDWDKCFVLTANIDLSSFSGTQFNIIGTDYDNAFSGVFDGQNYTISYFTYSSTDSERVGIFGVVDGDGAEIRDVGLYWPRVNVPSGRFMGCLVGSLQKGIVSGCRAVEGMIWGDYAVGGLIGYSDYRVSNCSYSGEVTGYDKNIGGVVGMNNGTIIRCSARGLVGGTTNAGGITGYNYGSVLVSYSRAAVSGWNLIGGLVGEHNYGTVSGCYSAGRVDGTNTAGGLVCYSRNRYTEVIDSFWDTQASGQSDSSGGIGKSTTEMHEPSTYQSAGWDFTGLPDGPSDIWLFPEGGGYPILGCEVLPEPELPAFSGGNGTAETPYLISTAGELNSIGYKPRLMDAHFRLTADIDLVGVEFFSVGNGLFPFAGVFDGDGHVVSNLSLDSTSPEYVGLFGVVSGSESKIADLHLIDPVIHSDAEGVGCIAGKLRSGTIQNCSVERGIVTGNSFVGGVAGTFAFGQIVNCRTSVDVDATGSYCGGLTGDNSNGTIEGCLSVGEVTCAIVAGGLVGLNYAAGLQSAFIDDCYSACRVSAQLYAGGLVGSNPWSGGRISKCYSTGAVSADSDFGGLVGFNPNVEEVVASFWNTETSGVAFSLGGTGLTTEEMQTMSTFTDAGWDFAGEDVNGEEDIWTICEGMNYPRFVWQVRPTDYVCPDGVGVEDLVYLAGRWLMEGEFAGAADADGDGVVGLGDFGVMCEAWGGN